MSLSDWGYSPQDLGWDPGDPPSYKSLEPRKTYVARKHHECYVCNEAIEPGQRYRRIVHLLDGEFEILKWHVAEECPAVGRKPGTANPSA